MKLNNLHPAKGAVHSRRRIGRGPGSGLGGTSTRGHKGAKARSGYKKKIGFEGGQMPLQRRIPKAGFKNINHKEYNVINLSTIQKIVEKRGLTEIGIIEFRESGVIKDKKLIKILANGDLKVKVNVEAHAFSKAAEDAIRAMGGSISII
ncbi:MAG: 50S ribosomal protein L15 [Prevotella micans]|jgi:ribosomal protein L15|nr:50S ribosomal protein L15 [Prevotella micans]